MYIIHLIVVISLTWLVEAQPGKCDQTPTQATVLEPTEDKGIYHLDIQNAPVRGDKIYYTPDQTYVLSIHTTVPTRPFRWFMITAEDPDVDKNVFEFSHKNIDVGTLKTLDIDKSQYSEACASTVENADNSDKTSVEIHWVSPKQSSKNQTVRIRAMVAENNEVWYTGDNLTVVLHKNTEKSPDSPPNLPMKICSLCSEARYENNEVWYTGDNLTVVLHKNTEKSPDSPPNLPIKIRNLCSDSGYEVIFTGKWSRVAHPRHYPRKPDENGYSHMVGASHAINYTLWQQGSSASKGLQVLAEETDSYLLERTIIADMAAKTGTRTLIRGKRRHHPYMSEPSHSLFRVDRYHHLFSIAVGMQPSPDWFLGTSKFELCTKDGWLEKYDIPLFPWDAGTMDGVSYESQKTVTTPQDHVDRVQVGSFNKDSPFYQMNLNDLKPFAILTVRRLDVFPLIRTHCSDDEYTTGDGEESQLGGVPEEESEDDPEEPVVGESRLKLDDETCSVGEWGAWSPCTSNIGNCGEGFTTRTRQRLNKDLYDDNYDYQDNVQAQPMSSDCEGDQRAKLVEYQNCFVDCN